MSEFAELPKVELHLHLEGAAPASFIRGWPRKSARIFPGFLARMVAMPGAIFRIS